jgi:hypothetical protein
MKDKVIYEKKEFLNLTTEDRSTVIAEVNYVNTPKIDASLTLYDKYGDKFNINLGFATPSQYREVIRSLDCIKDTIDELRSELREAEEYLETRKKEKYGT